MKIIVNEYTGLHDGKMFEVTSDGRPLCVLSVSPTIYDKETYSPSKSIMLVNPQGYHVILGTFPIKETEHDKPFDELAFIEKNIYEIKHSLFEDISRELKLSRILSCQ